MSSLPTKTDSHRAGGRKGTTTQERPSKERTKKNTIATEESNMGKSNSKDARFQIDRIFCLLLRIEFPWQGWPIAGVGTCAVA